MRLPKHEFGVSEVAAEVEYLVFVFVLDYCVFPGSYEFIQLGCDAGVSEVGGQVEYFVLRIQLKLNTALLSLFVRASVTGVTSHISHIYKGINAMLAIKGPIKPYIF